MLLAPGVHWGSPSPSLCRVEPSGGCCQPHVPPGQGLSGGVPPVEAAPATSSSSPTLWPLLSSSRQGSAGFNRSLRLHLQELP